MSNQKKAIEETSFDEIDSKIEELKIKKSLLFDQHISSKDPHDIIKANNYLKGIEKSTKTDPKAYLFTPNNEFYNGLGYKSSMKGITYDLLRKMGNTPIINAIISTRMEQVQNFSEFTEDLQKQGWTIRKKLGRFGDVKDYKPTDKDKKVIDKIASFLENGGNNTKWNIHDDIDVFLRKQTRDSLELDQSCFEVQRNRGFEPLSFESVDASTIRLLETIEDKDKNKYNFEEDHGYLPIYAQVWNNNILKDRITKEPVVFYPWEMSFGVRNRSTSVFRNGYGKSELEILVDIVTWLLWGMQYNGNFFKQGSTPKGFFTIDGDAPQNMLNEFRAAWRQTTMGVQNSHKIPIFEGNKIQWQDMMTNNKDMEFQNWNEFLMLTTCAVYKVDPSELGFQFSNQSNLFGQDGQKERLGHSKEKGLKPLLKMHSKQINKYLVSELDDQYEFLFTGIDLEDETQMLENDIKRVNSGFMSMEDGFEKYSGRKFNPDKDTPLNSVYWQAQQSKQFGGEESNQAVDEMTGEPEAGVDNPFDEYEKALDSNPIWQETGKYIDQLKSTYK